MNVYARLNIKPIRCGYIARTGPNRSLSLIRKSVSRSCVMGEISAWSDFLDDDWVSPRFRQHADTFYGNGVTGSLPTLNIPSIRRIQHANSDVTQLKHGQLEPLPTLKSANISPSASLLTESMKDLLDLDTGPSTKDYAEAVRFGQMEEAEQIMEDFLQQNTDIIKKLDFLKAAFDITKKFKEYAACLDVLHKSEELDPTNPTLALEAANIYNKIGDFEDEDAELTAALYRTKFALVLLTKMLKSLERRDAHSKARSILAAGSLQSDSVLLEGALFEIRHGPLDVGLELLDFCYNRNSDMIWRGSAYLEIVELCIRRGRPQVANRYATIGIREVPSLFALCTYSMRLQPTEKESLAIFESACGMSPMARPRIAHSLALHFFQQNLHNSARRVIALSAAASPADQRYKLFYNGAVLDFLYGGGAHVQVLLARGKALCPRKSRLPFDVFRAKILEMSGIAHATTEAHRVFTEVTRNYPDDWRAHMELTLFLARHSHRAEALKVVQRALQSMPENGRLLALRVQLEDCARQPTAFLEALQVSPKSGEVWLEGARIAMNPLSPFFSLKDARFFIRMARLFTPQYLDINIEMVRLELLEGGADADLSAAEDAFVNSEGAQGTVFHAFRLIGQEFTREEFAGLVRAVREDLRANSRLYQRAIARSAFVVPSPKEELAVMARDAAAAGPPERFAFGISVFGRKGRPMDVVGASATFI